jgi:hypothetical protein
MIKHLSGSTFNTARPTVKWAKKREGKGRGSVEEAAHAALTILVPLAILRRAFLRK